MLPDGDIQRNCWTCGQDKPLADFRVGGPPTPPSRDCSRCRTRRITVPSRPAKPAPPARERAADPGPRACPNCKEMKQGDDFRIGPFLTCTCRDCREIRNRERVEEQRRQPSAKVPPPRQRQRAAQPDDFPPIPSGGPVVARRWCSGCNQSKLLAAFGTRKSPTKKGPKTLFKSHCKDCLAAEARARRARKPVDAASC